jgi:hypothetical protein
MPLYKAHIKVTDSGKSFWTTVTAAHQGQVSEIIKSQWNNVIYIRNITEISGRDNYQEKSRPYYEDNTTFEEKFWLGVVFVVGYLVFVYWYVAVPLIFILGLLWWWAKD